MLLMPKERPFSGILQMKMQKVKGVIHACPCCKRIESKPFVAKTAPLPADCIRAVVLIPYQRTPPPLNKSSAVNNAPSSKKVVQYVFCVRKANCCFMVASSPANTGLDIAGPFFTRQGKKVNKNYICLFICMTTRAVHSEGVSEMTAPWLLQVLRRFIVRRDKPRVLQFQNFKSFKQLDKDLRQLVSMKMVNNIARELTSHRIQWNFITERAPWMGGYWERLIRSMKTSLKKVLQNSMLDEEKLRTCLTPYHFLTGTYYTHIPEFNRWKAEYVTNLNVRQKWYNSGNAPNIGDIVLVSESNVPRRNWKLGKIVQLYPGQDGIVRTVKVQLAGGSVNRPLSKLHLIEPDKVQ
ncbi:hypothetical protein T4D_14443 [Trichinella pseudospiralis]|uniref:DUF5641 domain-containing protein n=1 Tax=Trichinella pseudospiralis TaxID=6337 RepID=A0A0V1FS50_TRIPS|nr:hypothetical protein T4D_14443 [Trichinella pseudospiralis]